jgi:hypothetical protein
LHIVIKFTVVNYAHKVLTESAIGFKIFLIATHHSLKSSEFVPSVGTHKTSYDHLTIKI